MVISPSSSHSFWVPVVGNDIAVFPELVVANCAPSALFGDLPIEQLAHLGRRPKFPISPGVMRIVIVYALNA
jgi:hypothetical protein